MIDGKAVENVAEENVKEQIDNGNDTEEVAAEEKAEDIQKEEDLTSGEEAVPEAEEKKDPKAAAKEKKKKRKSWQMETEKLYLQSNQKNPMVLIKA